MSGRLCVQEGGRQGVTEVIFQLGRFGGVERGGAGGTNLVLTHAEEEGEGRGVGVGEAVPGGGRRASLWRRAS